MEIDEERIRQEERIRFEERRKLEEAYQQAIRAQQKEAYRQFCEKKEKEHAERKAQEQKEQITVGTILAAILLGGIPYLGWLVLILGFCYCLRRLIREKSMLAFCGTMFLLFVFYLRYMISSAC